MGQKLGHPLDCNCLGRRKFLKMTSGATVAGMMGGSLFLADRARADALSKDLRDKLTPEQMVQAMKNEQALSDGRKETTQLPSRTESRCQGTIPCGRLANIYRFARTSRGHHGPESATFLTAGLPVTSETRTS
jgi:hypothetical protein